MKTNKLNREKKNLNHDYTLIYFDIVIKKLKIKLSFYNYSQIGNNYNDKFLNIFTQIVHEIFNKKSFIKIDKLRIDDFLRFN